MYNKITTYTLMTRQDSSLSLDKNTGESMAAKLSSKKTTKNNAR